MIVYEQKTGQSIEVDHYYKERQYNPLSHSIRYCIVSIYQHVPKTLVTLGTYFTEARCEEVWQELTKAKEENKAYKMPR